MEKMNKPDLTHKDRRQKSKEKAQEEAYCNDI